MRGLLIFILIPFLEFGFNDYIPNSTKSFNLAGPIKFISEKVISVTCDSNWNVLNDSIGLWDNYYFENYYFDKKGNLIKTENFNDDSISYGFDNYIYDKSLKFRMINCYKNGKLDKIIKLASIIDSVIVTYTLHSESEKLTDSTRIMIKNGLILSKTNYDVERNKIFLEQLKRNKDQNVIEVLDSTLGVKTENNVSKFKYLEFDKKGNWSKCLWFKEENEECRLIFRRIKYY